MGQTPAGSDLIDQSTGAVNGSFPLFDDFDYVTQESDGNLLFSGNGYVETVGPTGTVLSSFGSSRTRGAGAHTGSGTQFYYPAQAVQGPDGTIYTADPLNTIESTSPRGYLAGHHDPGPEQRRRLSTWPWVATTSIWSAPRSSIKGDRRSTAAPTTSPPSRSSTLTA